ncbi:Uncharacterised protein [Vibrio cholerae]|nr:Uncharacterised protein [Vibrio cholerae]
MPSKRGFTQCGGIIGRKGAGYFDYVVAFCPFKFPIGRPRGLIGVLQAVVSS